MRQNDAKMISVGHSRSHFNRLLLKKIGAKTNTFLSHCSGRSNLMYCIIGCKDSANRMKCKINCDLFSFLRCCLFSSEAQRLCKISIKRREYKSCTTRSWKNRATGATEDCNYLIISESTVQDWPKIVLLWCY